ncbi:RNA polymerase sigma factor [Ruminiclostridium cellulolyticum]|uniref:RNA polymerase, sigma-24 subunit, ECF subfamily n=1 Tax=Ruminiclostridium cellulolyticum (strain ATCC 35319 / DSM 5812 / JCM 6584 / H10) TaxID=394503 RepID=B8I346_RUMCH|nr:sigma-70 family RNA polymerase sigma factor [Ruminiclostridium cellulolyticum]ACL76189.1 RNA polymerase, sigma-24 subunit, ECF subfamily [Ruminiclostridium cellulolyticum H10]
MTNEELIPKAKQGDKQALQALYDNNIGIMHKLIFRYSVSKQDRDDFLQECYFVLLNCVKAYKPEREILFISYLGNAIVWMILRKKGQMRKYENNVSLNSKVNNDTEDVEFIDMLQDSEAEKFVDDIELSFIQSEVQKILTETTDHPVRELIFENLGKQLSIRYLSKKYNLTERDIHNHINKARDRLKRNHKLRALAEDYGIIAAPVKTNLEELINIFKAENEWLRQRKII